MADEQGAIHCPKCKGCDLREYRSFVTYFICRDCGTIFRRGKRP